MKSETSTTQRSGEKITSNATMVGGKVLEAIVVSDRAVPSAYAYCACGSGGGCSGDRQ